MRRISLGAKEFRAALDSPGRRLSITAALGLVIMMCLGAGVLPAAAATDSTQRQAASMPSSNVTQALVVGSMAFALIIAVAGAVLYYTAKGAKSRHSGTAE